MPADRVIARAALVWIRPVVVVLGAVAPCRVEGEVVAVDRVRMWGRGRVHAGERRREQRKCGLWRES